MRQDKNKNLLATTLFVASGSCLEYYNYSLFIYLIPIWGKELFAPGSDQNFKGFGIICLTSLIRPIAASLIGKIGDKAGRRYALFVCAGLMSTACLAMSYLPRYDNYNFLTKYNLLTLTIILCRLFQIASVSGKLNGSAIFLIEHLPNKAGLISGFMWSITVIGMLIAALVEYACSISMNPNSWRLPIRIGGIVGFIGFIAIKYLSEGKEYVESKNNKNQEKFLSAKDKTFANLTIACVGSAIGGIFYYSITYIPQLHKGINLSDIALNRVNLLLIYCLSVLLGGLLSHKLQHKKSNTVWIYLVALVIVILTVSSSPLYLNSKVKNSSNILVLALALSCIGLLKLKSTTGGMAEVRRIMTWGAVGTLLLAYFGLTEVIHHNSLFIHSCMLVFMGLYVGPSHQLMSSIFPISMRYSSISLYYGIGTAFFGGSSTFVCMYMAKIHRLLPVVFIFTCASLALASIYLSKKVRFARGKIEDNAG